MPLSQQQAQQYGLRAPQLGNELLNVARGADPTMGLLSGMLPEPQQQDPMLQLLAAIILPTPDPLMSKKVIGMFARHPELLGILRGTDEAAIARIGETFTPRTRDLTTPTELVRLNAGPLKGANLK